MTTAKIKICVIKDIDTLQKIVELNIDYVGFIFFNKSPRNVD